MGDAMDDLDRLIARVEAGTPAAGGRGSSAPRIHPRNQRLPRDQ